MTKVWQLWYFYERSHHNLNFIRIWPEKNYFLRGTLGSDIGFGFKYGLEILQQCDKRAETNNQKVLRSNSYDCGGYRGNTGRGRGFLRPHPE